VSPEIEEILLPIIIIIIILTIHHHHHHHHHHQSFNSGRSPQTLKRRKEKRTVNIHKLKG